MHIFRCCLYLGFYAVALCSGLIPGPPLNVEVTANDATSISVRWNAPNSTNEEVVGYYIQISTEGYNRVHSCVNCYEKMIMLLKPHTTYSVVVYAFNSIGDGERSRRVEITTRPEMQMDVPGPPSHVDIMQAKENSSITLYVKWKAPNRPNGEVKGYYIQVTKTIDGEERNLSCVGRCYKKEVQQLEPNTDYSVAVYAFNSIGNGEKSRPVKVHTNRVPPSPPRAIEVAYYPTTNRAALITWKAPEKMPGLPVITSFSSVAFITWRPPEKTYGLPVLSYSVEVKEIGTNSSKGAIDSTTTALLFPGLDPGVDYIVSVKARNAAGSSDQAEESFVLPLG